MSDALKKRKSKVLRSETGTPEGKCGREEGDQVSTSLDRRVTFHNIPMVLLSVFFKSR